MKDIAAACATTVPTVSYVLSGSKTRYVNARLREQILACAKEMGYEPVQRRSGSRVSQKIAIVLPQIENTFFSQMIIGMEREICCSGYLPVIFHTGDVPQREALIMDTLSAESFSGYLLVPSEKSLLSEAILHRLKSPYIVVERPLPCEGDYDFFSMDNFHAGYLATKELIRAGHRHIGFIGWQSTALTLLDRRLGYARALEEASILYRPEYVHGCDTTEEDCYRVTRDLLSSQSSITALILANHMPGIGGVRYLHDAGIRIPEDLSVLVIGDPSWVKLSTPVFSHITLPSLDVGAVAAHALIAQIEAKKTGVRERVALKGRFIQGGSVAQPSL
ncbi:MAG: LacI family DNA-binding transcriptional regulator [Clostridia bacterium]|nr:LacI family DNA-binding transcriptional regulator [Clostridia bacterium]